MPRLEQLAAAWGVTPRTVIRRLADHGVRYGDPANFGRAFKRLTGQAPGEYRRRTRSS